MRLLFTFFLCFAVLLSACSAEQPRGDAGSENQEFSNEQSDPHDVSTTTASEVIDKPDNSPTGSPSPDKAVVQAIVEGVTIQSLDDIDAQSAPLSAATTEQFNTVTVRSSSHTRTHEPTATTITVDSLKLSAAHAPWLYSTVNESTRRAHGMLFGKSIELLQSEPAPKALQTQSTWLPLSASGDSYTLRLTHELLADGVVQQRVVDHIHGQVGQRYSVTGLELIDEDRRGFLSDALAEITSAAITSHDVHGTFLTSAGELVIPLSVITANATDINSVYVVDAAISDQLVSSVGTALLTDLQAPTPFVGLGPAFRDCRQLKCVAMTFDDGPGPYTNTLLDILAAHNAQATFFVLGSRVQQNPELTRRLLTDGHEVAGHSFDHPEFTKIDDAQIAAQIEQSAQAMRDAGVPPSGLFRLPYGSFDDRVLQALRHGGLNHVSWSVDPEDWRVREPNAIAFISLASIGASDIVLFHDIKEPSVQAMNIMIPWLQSEGYTLVTVSELIAGQYEPGHVVFAGPPPLTP